MRGGGFTVRLHTFGAKFAGTWLGSELAPEDVQPEHVSRALGSRRLDLLVECMSFRADGGGAHLGRSLREQQCLWDGSAFECTAAFSDVKQAAVKARHEGRRKVDVVFWRLA